MPDWFCNSETGQEEKLMADSISRWKLDIKSIEEAVRAKNSKLAHRKIHDMTRMTNKTPVVKVIRTGE